MINDNKNSGGVMALGKLFDNGNYTEIGAHMTRPGSADEYEGVVCAYGPVNGRLVFAFAQDSNRMKGAFDSLTSKKIDNLYSLALKSGAPVVGVFSGSGSVVTEGSALLCSLSGLLSSVASAWGDVPQIALITGSCTGCMAVAASMFDVSVCVKGAEYSMGAGFLTDGKGAKASLTAETEAEAYEMTRALINALPDNCECGPAFADETNLNRATGITEEEALDAEKLIAAISDDGSFTELFGKGDSVKVGLAPVAGRYVGVVAAWGELCAKCADKICELVSLCDRFSIPTITLINSNGFEISAKAEQAGSAKAAARLALAYRNHSAHRISAVIGRACGAVLPIMGSSNGAADVSFALRNSVIAPLTPERAVAFLENHKISGEVTREELEKAYASEKASAELAAFNGDVDFLVSIEELRARICGALLMLDRE